MSLSLINNSSFKLNLSDGLNSNDVHTRYIPLRYFSIPFYFFFFFFVILLIRCREDFRLVHITISLNVSRGGSEKVGGCMCATTAQVRILLLCVPTSYFYMNESMRQFYIFNQKDSMSCTSRLSQRVE